ncbi:MAG: MarR family winged helix-turn-helix transcriptional regulator [Marinosulfonomonas sp.]
MKDAELNLYKLILEIRAASDELNQISTSLNDRAGITSAERSVLDSLFGKNERTVPQIANAKNVSRQHIQLLVDGLAAKGLVRHATNPTHKRSKLVLITDTGRNIIQDIRDKEAITLSELAEGLDFDTTQSATRALRDLRREVSKTRR